MQDIYIVGARRTPIGKFRGKLKDFSAVDLGVIALKETAKSVGLDLKNVDTIILGNVLSTGLGENPARQVGLLAGMDEKSTAMTVNQVCGSSLKAVRLGESLINMGDADLIAVGGIESMTNAPKFEDAEGNLKPTLMNDGLNDAFSKNPMGITAENVAEKYHITREMQDQMALSSQQKAFSAAENGWFKDEIIPIEIDDEVMDMDESIREDTSLAKLKELKPIFKEQGSVTAGNASPINDGASMLILANDEAIKKYHLKPLAKLVGYAEAGTDPEYMGYAPYYAINKLLEKTNSKLADYDAFEINEAFAAQVLAVGADLQIPKHKINPAGGAISLGHPLGATGARLIVSLINDLKQNDDQKGIASLCIGGGMGIAYAIELVPES